MHNWDICMQVEHSFYYLSENSASCELTHLAIRQLFNVFSEWNSLYVVCNKEYLFGRVDQVMQVDDAWVLQSL